MASLLVGFVVFLVFVLYVFAGLLVECCWFLIIAFVCWFMILIWACFWLIAGCLI